MKKIILLFTFCVLFIISSCKKSQNESKPSLLSNLRDTNFISLSIAIKAANRVDNNSIINSLKAPSLKKVMSSSVTDSSNVTQKEILNSIIGPDENNPSFYIFNYKNGGFVIISADKRVEPVLAFSEEGYFSKTGSMPLGLVTWMSMNDENMQKIRKNHDIKAPGNVVKLWNSLLTENKAINTNLKTMKVQDPPPPCQDQYNVDTHGPLLPTQWAQGQGYNDFCPTGTYFNGHAPTGCVATAMAQILRYWQLPAAYN